MKALITGAKGQLGRALLVSVPQGWDCAGHDRTTLDLTNPDAVRAMIIAQAPDVVFNAAAYTAVDKAESDGETARAVNVDAVAAMRDALAATGGRLVHVSTDFVFDGQSSRAYQPGHERNPLSVYGSTKADGEDAAAGSGNIVVRTSWVYGAGGANFVNTMLRLMRERDALNVVADQIGSPTHAAGLAQTLWSLVDKGAEGVFHHRDAGVASWYDFAVAIFEEASALGMLSRDVAIMPIATAQYPTPAQRPAFSLLDDSATRALLGDTPVHWRTNLRKMLKEEKALG